MGNTESKRYTIPAENEIVSLQTNVQSEFIRTSKKRTWGKAENSGLDWLHLQRTGKQDFSFPEPVHFAWTDDGRGIGYSLSVSESPTFDTSVTWEFTVPDNCADISNFKIGQQYYWRINGGKIHTFTTASDYPRFISVGGLSNVRDIGGFPTLDGKKIRQGCIYRGCELDTHHNITRDGIMTLYDQLKIRTDLDLRGEAARAGRISSPVGISYLLIPCDAYAKFLPNSVPCVRLFEALADKTNYPIYFHCWGGADRTGTLAFLLEALLGVSDEDLLCDYELTSLSIWGDRSRNSDLFVSLIDALTPYGDNFRTQAENYLLSVGVTPETIAAIRTNLL